MSNSIADLQNKVVKGSFSYIIRQILGAIIQISSNFFILKYLLPADFGYFSTITLILSIAQILADGGLSVYLIQRLEKIDNKILSRIASLQFYVYLFVHLSVLIALIFNKFENQILLFSFFSFFTIPLNIFRSNTFVLLERELAFKKISFIEVIESFVFAIFSLLFAILGFRIWSLIIASILKSLIGLIIAKKIYNWKFTFQKIVFNDDLKKAIKYGFNYHTPTLVNTLRLAINPILIGSLLGAKSVGIADRAIYFAGLPLFFLGAVQQKVLFPYFAKIQENNILLKSNFEKMFYLSAIIDKIIYIPMVLFAQVIISKYMPQWKDAIPIFYIVIVGNIFFGAFSFSIYPLLNGVGRSDIIAKLSFISVLVTWVITWPLVKFFGLDGYAYVSSFLWVFGLIPTLFLLNKVIPDLKVKKQFILTFLAFSISVSLVYMLFNYFDIQSILNQICLSVFGILLYFILLYLFDGKNILRILDSLFLVIKI